MTAKEAGLRVQLVEDATAEKIASIIGESSAYAQALKELARRRNNDEDVCLVSTGRMVLVVPRTALTPHQ